MRKRIERIILVLTILSAMLTAAIEVWVWFASHQSHFRLSNVPSRPSIEQIQELSQLVTERVNVSDVIESQLIGRAGSLTAIVVVKGSVLISTDLSLGRFEFVDGATRLAVLVLRQPAVLEATLDHERTRVLTLYESGLWRITPGDNATSAAIVDLAYRDAQRFVDAAAKDDALVGRARLRTEQALADFLRRVHWNLVVRWQ